MIPNWRFRHRVVPPAPLHDGGIRDIPGYDQSHERRNCAGQIADSPCPFLRIEADENDGHSPGAELEGQTQERYKNGFKASKPAGFPKI